MEALKKWKTIAIAAILVAVISLGGLCYTMVRSGAAQTGTQAAPAVEQTAAAGNETAEGEQTAPAADEAAAETQTNAIDANEMLSLWNEGAPAREKLIAYMDEITKEGSPDYIPVENRIAVFDFDGTLFEDPEYKDRASEFEKMVAAKIIDQNTNGTKYAELPVEHGQAVASAFKGMTMREFLDYIQEFKKLPMPSYEGMTRGGGFYEPMLQIINYLKANDFTVYVISGTDRFICRGIMENSPLELPNSQIIGSDETIVAGLQNGEDGLNYTFTQGDDLYLGGEFIIKNLKMNKVSVINSEIGVQPDAAMCNYALSNNPYKSLAFMLCCDDLERENGNTKKADDMYKLCEENNWIPVSMKNDWKTIYAEGVKYIGKQAVEPAAAEQPAVEEPAAEQPATEEPAAEEQEEVLDNAA